MPSARFRHAPCLLFLILLAILLPGQLERARAGEQADRALAAVDTLIREGVVQKGDTLRIVAKQGNINNFWGEDFGLKTHWESQTGIILDFQIRPQLPVLDYLRSTPDCDITLARQREYPDLVHEQLIAELDPLFLKFDFDLKGAPPDGFLLPDMQSRFSGQTVAVPADGDIAVMYLRRDLLEDPKRQREFKVQYGRELSAPQTWDEYQELVEFFHDPASGFFGSVEQRDPDTGWMFWMPRYLSQSAPNQYLFDDAMHPLIDSPAGIAATQSYLATIPFSPPGILGKGNDYSYTLPIYRRGKAFSSILTVSMAKLLNAKGSAVKHDFMCVPMPGKMISGRLLRRTTFIYGNNIVIPSNSPQKELAFLYAMWLTDPDVSLQSVKVRSGFADPYRYNHFKDEEVRAIYSRQALNNALGEIGSTVPAGTGLPGDNEYIRSLNKNLWRAGKGEFSAAEAMRRTAKRWEEITERYGRASQIRHWSMFRNKFPMANRFPGKGL